MNRTPADYIIGVHPVCGGLIEIVEYAAVCLACGGQDWSDDGSSPYIEGLLEMAVSLHESPDHDPGDEDRS